MSEIPRIEAVVENDGRLGHVPHGHTTFAQFQHQLIDLCRELNSFPELTAAERDIDEAPTVEPRGVEQLFEALSRQLLGTLPSGSSRCTAVAP